MPTRIESFNFQDVELASEYVETVEVIPGKVFCDVYKHPKTQERDLAIVSVSPGCHTPIQEVLSGEETIEGYLSGKGKLVVIQRDGTIAEYALDSKREAFSYSAEVGQIIQLQASETEPLEFFEICYPPFEEGRFNNLSENKL